ncbi:DUF4870 domain-containing protein [Halovenus rubra]|uniref:DUF4870 domain-containing protein n=2 Tax=Halovenus rubra TaxID=869890 RepID=A0ACC7E034_9EURY|nr:DUF4870 domain-containing protein [Halovenus rubra]
MAQQYCRGCGSSVAFGDRYCPECGQRLDTSDSQSDHAGTQTNTSHSSQGQWGANKSQRDTNTAGTRGGHGYGRRNQSETTIAALTHVLALLTWVIGPLIVYVVVDDPFVRANAANATNWQVMLTFYIFISAMFMVGYVGIYFAFMLVMLGTVFVVIAAIKASKGECWSYPLTPPIL